MKRGTTTAWVHGALFAAIVLVAGCRGLPEEPCVPPCGIGAPREAAARLLSVPAWVVPASSRAAHSTTCVRIRLAIDASGSPTQGEILTTYSVLDTVALATALATSWEPARSSDVAVASWDTLALFGCGECDGAWGSFVYYTDPPTLVHEQAPVYPPRALEIRLEATVKVQALVGTDGSVWCSRVTKSVNLLDSAAVDAVWQGQWRPARNDLTPVTAWVEVPVRFDLPEP